MRRLIWLLAFPYVVATSTYQVMCSKGPIIKTDRGIGTMTCDGTQEECEDLAEALNSAHERREDRLSWNGKRVIKHCEPGHCSEYEWELP